MTASVDTVHQLNDLPATFVRLNTPYLQLVESINAGLQRFTQNSDATVGQVFGNASFGWLDTWGAIFGIVRFSNEGDAHFRSRIVATLLAWVGTTPAIQQWANTMLGPGVTVTDNATLGAIGYSLTFPPSLSVAQIAGFIAGLARIRPAGVPFLALQQQTGLYLDTVNFLDTSAAIGSYLSDGTVAVPGLINGLTNSTKPLIPEYYFADPLINAS